MKIGGFLLQHQIEEGVDFGHNGTSLSVASVLTEISGRRKQLNSLAHILRAEIEAGGPVSCARFMEQALHHPEHGFYERADAIGRAGDFITSVSVGPLFGRLLAWQFRHWLGELSGGCRIAECGAHDGALAEDILAALNHGEAPGRERVRYRIIEPSAGRKAWQQERLRAHEDIVAWCEDVRAATSSGLRGVIFANELLDAFPAHVLGWDAVVKSWVEWGVGTAEGGLLVWQRLEKTPPETLLRLIPKKMAQAATAGLLADGGVRPPKDWPEAG
jgi:SAM-dependent MidA family methyltransferase